MTLKSLLAPAATLHVPSVGYSVAPSYDYIPALDGIRAVSVTMVMLAHFAFKRIIPGGLGVTVFFFVSGFLITRQLLAEQDARGQVALGAFYFRRLLRLYPALLVMIFVGGIIFEYQGGDLSVGQVLAAVFYYTNYYAPYGNYVPIPPGMFHPFGILWSLAVEEHYYILFPALVFLLGRARISFVATLAAGILVVTLWRMHVGLECSLAIPSCLSDFSDQGRIVDSTDTRLDSILYGALLASMLATRWSAPLLRLLQSPLAFAFGTGLMAFSLLSRDPLFRDTLRFTVQGIGLFLLIGSVLFSARLSWLRRILSTRSANLVGRWSYSLYLWHPIVLLCVVSQLPPTLWKASVDGSGFSPVWGFLATPLLFCLSLVTAAASYRFVETPMVAVRRRFGAHAVRDAGPLNVG